MLQQQQRQSHAKWAKIVYFFSISRRDKWRRFPGTARFPRFSCGKSHFLNISLNLFCQQLPDSLRIPIDRPRLSSFSFFLKWLQLASLHFEFRFCISAFHFPLLFIFVLSFYAATISVIQFNGTEMRGMRTWKVWRIFSGYWRERRSDCLINYW